MELKVAQEIYKKIKCQPTYFKEEIHCPLVIKIMATPDKATYSAFCKEVQISEKTFYNWCHANENFMECYAIGKMYSRELWEDEGRRLRDEIQPMGTISHAFEYWRMIGWTRFGIGKTSKLRLLLNPESSPTEHYKQLLQQAQTGDFTASEFKQLMESINVGLTAHQVIKLQEEINQIKMDLGTMESNQQNGIVDKKPA